jgi:hypothetical protein
MLRVLAWEEAQVGALAGRFVTRPRQGATRAGEDLAFTLSIFARRGAPPVMEDEDLDVSGRCVEMVPGRRSGMAFCCAIPMFRMMGFLARLCRRGSSTTQPCHMQY